MNSLEFTKPITTESLLKEFESRFNMTMDLSKFNEEELQDYANHVRTKIHEITQNTHFGQELKDNSYQKSQMMLDVINQAINERKLAEYGGSMSNDPVTKVASTTLSAKAKLDKGQALDQEEKKVVQKIMTKEGVKEGHYPHIKSFDKLYGISDKQQYKAMADDAQSMDMGEFMDTYSSVIDMAGDFWEDHQKTSESMEGTVNEDPNTLAKELASEIMRWVRRGLDFIPTDALKPKAREYLRSVKKSAVKEGVEEQSELILAAKDMMDKVTSFLEDLASMKTEGALELVDRIRDEMGAEKADAFLQKIQPAIEQAEATLTTTRQELDNGVRILTGEEVASDPMGADDTMDMDNTDADLDDLGTDDLETDEFGASDAEAGGTEPEGREQRESKEVFEASNRLFSKLAGK